MKHVGRRTDPKDIVSRDQLVFRELLTAARTYYVRTDGSDSNDGLSNSSAGAFATIQKAIDIAGGLDAGIFAITISVGAGTFAGVLLKDPLGAGSVTIQGAGATQTILETISTHTINTGLSRKYQLIGFRVQNSGGIARGLFCGPGSSVIINGLDFGACAAYHIDCSGTVTAASYSISGGALIHWYAANGGAIVCAGYTVTLTGTPNFSTGFAVCDIAAFLRVNANTFSGVATGKRYTVSNGGVIYVAGAGESYLPGNAAGTVGVGGQYA